MVKSQSRRTLQLLLPLLPTTEGETLYLLLETVRAVLGLDKDLLTEENTPEVAEMVYQIWLQYTDGEHLSDSPP